MKRVMSVTISLSFTPGVLEVLLQLHFRNVADLVSCFNVFLNVVFAVLRSLGRRSPLLEHTICLDLP